MPEKIPQIQIGKQGITENFLQTLKSYFDKHKNVKISVLPSARPEGKEGKKQVKEYNKQILDYLGKKFTSRVIGFTIVLKKWRKDRR